MRSNGIPLVGDECFRGRALERATRQFLGKTPKRKPRTNVTVVSSDALAEIVAAAEAAIQAGDAPSNRYKSALRELYARQRQNNRPLLRNVVPIEHELSKATRNKLGLVAPLMNSAGEEHAYCLQRQRELLLRLSTHPLGGENLSSTTAATSGEVRPAVNVVSTMPCGSGAMTRATSWVPITSSFGRWKGTSPGSQTAQSD